MQIALLRPEESWAKTQQKEINIMITVYGKYVKDNVDENDPNLVFSGYYVARHKGFLDIKDPKCEKVKILINEYLHKDYVWRDYTLGVDDWVLGSIKQMENYPHMSNEEIDFEMEKHTNTSIFETELEAWIHLDNYVKNMELLVKPA
jgi:hypothetical protein